MKPLVEDKELKRLREMATLDRAFRKLAKWERLSALDLREIAKLPARERLGLGYYTYARERSARAEQTA